MSKLSNGDSDKRNWLVKLTIIMVAFGILFIGIYFNAHQYILRPTLNHSIEKAQSKQEVDSYYTSKTPGLKRAERLGLVTEINKTIAVTGDTSLTIEKIWYNSDEIFIFYNANVSKQTMLLDQESLPRLRIITVKPADGEKFPPQSLSLYTKNIGPREGIIYNNHFYHRMVALPIRTQNNEIIKHIDEEVIFDLRMEINNKLTTVSDVKIPLKYDEEQQPLHSFTVNKSIENELFKLTFDQIDIGINKNFLYGEIESSNNDDLRDIRGTITTDNGEDFTIIGRPRQSEKDPGAFIFETQAFNTEPNEININIDYVSFVGEDSFDFSLDVSDYEQQISNSSGQYEKKLHKKIDEIKQTTIYLERLYYDDRGINFDILYEPKDKNQKVHLLESTPVNLREQKHSNHMNLPTEVSAVNGEGIDGEFGQRSTGPGSQFGIFLNSDFIQSSREVDVTVKDLLYRVVVNDSIAFPVTFP